MLDVLLCYGFAAQMVRAGYFALVTDLFRQAWGTCRGLGAAAARLPTRGSALTPRGAGEIVLRRLDRIETFVTSMP
jgi:hypothetical protein